MTSFFLKFSQNMCVVNQQILATFQNSNKKYGKKNQKTNRAWLSVALGTEKEESIVGGLFRQNRGLVATANDRIFTRSYPSTNTFCMLSSVGTSSAYYRNSMLGAFSCYYLISRFFMRCKYIILCSYFNTGERDFPLQNKKPGKRKQNVTLSGIFFCETHVLEVNKAWLFLS